MDALKAQILQKLRLRTQRETRGYKELIFAYGHLESQLEQCRKTISRLEYEKDQNDGKAHESGSKEESIHIKVDSEEHKYLQQELHEAIRKKAEYADKVCEQADALKKVEAELLVKENRCKELESLTASLQEKLQNAEENVTIVSRTSEAIMTEHQSLQALYNSQQTKLKDLERDCMRLTQHVLDFKKKEAELLNDDTVRSKRIQELKQLKELEESVGGGRKKGPQATSAGPSAPSLPPSTGDKSTSPSSFQDDTVIYPATPFDTFDAHDVEVSALCFSPDGNYLATGGGDKIVKVWNVRQDLRTTDTRCTLTGSGGSIMSLQFDQSSAVVLASSQDNAARIWSLQDQRNKHTLAGHSNKVMAAKFLEDNYKVVTGSHDSTLKLWDLQKGLNPKTFLAISRCNDVIAGRGMGSTIISGHLDQKVRLWDTRSGNASDEITLEGKITSLDYLPERQHLLSCCRDNTIRLVDLRKKSVVSTFTADGFNVTLDWSRACFSPEGKYIASGSSDGTVFVWEVSTGKVRSKKEHSSVVVNCAWHPSGYLFASAERTKKVTLWSR